MADKRESTVMDDLLDPEITEGLSPEEEALVRWLAREFERSLDLREVRRRGKAGISEMAIGALGLLRTLRDDEIRVRVGNPGGHRAGRTAVEVVARDRPFLVDTLRLNLRRLGVRERLLLHPLLPLDRAPDRTLQAVRKDGGEGPLDCFLYAEVPCVRESGRREEIERELGRVYTGLHTLVRDHGRMVRALRRHVAGIERAAPVLREGFPQAERVIEFLEWLADDNYLFFGYRYYDLSVTEGSWSVAASPESGLGILRDLSLSRFREPRAGSELPSVLQARLADERIVFCDKARSDSEIHRAGKLDCIRIKDVDRSGNTVGFGQFLGLLTNRAIRTRGSEIAILRERRRRVLEILEMEPDSYTYKTAVEAYDSLPVEVLFQFDVPDVARAVERVVSVTEVGGPGVYLFPDPLSRSFFITVILPRSRYDEDLRRDLEKLLHTKYGATYTDNRVSFLDDQIALIHFFCSAGGEIDLAALQEIEWDIQARVARWEEGLEAALLDRETEERAYALVDEYGGAFPESYQVVTPGRTAVHDVESLERLRAAKGKVQLDLRVEADELCHLKVYQSKRPYLTDLLPTLDHFGMQVLDARLTEVVPASGDPLWVVTVRLEGLDDLQLETRMHLLDALRRAISGEVRDDELHALILRVGLTWSEVLVLRAYLAYAHQIGTSPSRRFLSDVLAKFPRATRALVALFRARFDPDLAGPRDEAEDDALQFLDRARSEIRAVAEDRVFSLISNLIQSTVRTSHFAPPIGGAPLVAFKFDPSRIQRMPAPRPFAEIYIHSAVMSGIHLRGGRVARGGVRWSDRAGDFRTEILGLMKTQMVKNGLIVPVGSKGGFVILPRILDQADDAGREVKHQYARFIRGLLSVTDDLVEGSVVLPDRVVRHDDDDPYLVVAPDKGTAKFSDVANRVAEQVGFWLGDAFASGGSEGYDHKSEGITARGAWVCVRRHFQELGSDIEREPFTVVGIGDMLGDVFGNGMLLARKAKLLAAFNHLHIFLDPSPDPEAAWQERKRLFDLPRSSWSEYDPAKISEGGGVYERSAKEIPLSPQTREMLGVDQETLTGEELVRAMLRMPVDLLWNGGIGTYVKASDESHADVGDRTNDSVRVDADELRARVVGEGGNLGLTPRARVEFALLGGCINTDAVDNSGGVDLSDHEVNFKILLAPTCRAGTLSRDERNQLLSECLPEAVEAVLWNNTSQSLSLSLDERRAREDPEGFLRATEFLTRHGGLDLQLEGLPDPEEIRTRAASRTGPVYTRPELAVLLGYTKMLAKRSLLDSHELDLFGHLLEEYFPVALRSRFRDEIARHPLCREITATALVTRVVDRSGVALVPALAESLGIDRTDALVAYQLAGWVLDAETTRRALYAEPLAEETRLRALIRLEEAVRSGARTLIGLERHPPRNEVALEGWRRGQQNLRKHLAAENGSVRVGVRDVAQRFSDQGLPPALADEIAWLPAVVRALPVLPLIEDLGRPPEDLVRAWVRIGEAVRVSDLLDRLDAEGRHGGWDRLAAEGLILDLLEVQRKLTAAALREGTRHAERFLEDHRAALERISSVVERIEGEPTLAPAAFVVQQLRRLC